MNYRYKVEFTIEGKKNLEAHGSDNAGAAFAACLKKHPDAILIKATVEGSAAGAKGEDGKMCYGFSEHFPPAVQRPIEKPHGLARALNKKEHGCEFPFYDQVKGIKQ